MFNKRLRRPVDDTAPAADRTRTLRALQAAARALQALEASQLDIATAQQQVLPTCWASSFAACAVSVTATRAACLGQSAHVHRKLRAAHSIGLKRVAARQDLAAVTIEQLHAVSALLAAAAAAGEGAGSFAASVACLGGAHLGKVILDCSFGILPLLRLLDQPSPPFASPVSPSFPTSALPPATAPAGALQISSHAWRALPDQLRAAASLQASGPHAAVCGGDQFTPGHPEVFTVRLTHADNSTPVAWLQDAHVLVTYAHVSSQRGSNTSKGAFLTCTSVHRDGVVRVEYTPACAHQDVSDAGTELLLRLQVCGVGVPVTLLSSSTASPHSPLTPCAGVPAPCTGAPSPVAHPATCSWGSNPVATTTDCIAVRLPSPFTPTSSLHPHPSAGEWIALCRGCEGEGVHVRTLQVDDGLKSCVAIHPDGSCVVVALGLSCALSVYALPSGALLRRIGTEGSRPLQFRALGRVLFVPWNAHHGTAASAAAGSGIGAAVHATSAASSATHRKRSKLSCTRGTTTEPDSETTRPSAADHVTGDSLTKETFTTAESNTGTDADTDSDTEALSSACTDTVPLPSAPRPTVVQRQSHLAHQHQQQGQHRQQQLSRTQPFARVEYHILVVEPGNRRLQQLTCEGVFVRFIGAGAFADGRPECATLHRDALVVGMSGGRGPHMLLFAFSTGQAVATFGGPARTSLHMAALLFGAQQRVTCSAVAFTPDGSHLLVGEDAQVSVYDVACWWASGLGFNTDACVGPRAEPGTSTEVPASGSIGVGTGAGALRRDAGANTGARFKAGLTSAGQRRQVPGRIDTSGREYLTPTLVHRFGAGVISSIGLDFAVCPSGNVLVADSGCSRVHVFVAGTGAFVRSWGGSGSAAGCFQKLAGLATHSVHVYAFDTYSNRLQVFI